MAACTKQTETIVKIKSVTLELTEAEATTLSQFLCKIGGCDPETGHRARLNQISDALRGAGFNRNFELPTIGCGRIYTVENRPDFKIVDSNNGW